MILDKRVFVDNPINRYSIGQYTDGLKNNADGTLDIYIQNASPGADKESNWLPSAESIFTMVMRMYLPQPVALNGTWQLTRSTEGRISNRYLIAYAIPTC